MRVEDSTVSKKTIIQVNICFANVTKSLEQDINKFLEKNNIGGSELVDIKYQASERGYSAIVIYKKSINN